MYGKYDDDAITSKEMFFHVVRFSIENIPLYDSEDDGPSTRLLKPIDSLEDSSWLNEKENGLMDDDIVDEKMKLEEDEDEKMKLEEDEDEKAKLEEDEDSKMQSQDSDTNTSHIQSNNTSDNKTAGQNKGSVCHSGGRSKTVAQKQVNVKLITHLLLSKEAQEEVLAYEEARNLAKAQLDSLYDEIRPAIEELEKDSQDSVSTSVAERWIEACCSKQKAEFDLYFSVIKNVSNSSSRLLQDEVHVKVEDSQNELDSNC